MDHTDSSVGALLQTEEGRREFLKDELAFAATEKIAELMTLEKVSKSELARRTGNSKAHITQLLSGSHNMTLHTLAGCAFALGYRIDLDAKPLAHRSAGESDSKMKLFPVQIGNGQERALPAPVINTPSNFKKAA